MAVWVCAVLGAEPAPGKVLGSCAGLCFALPFDAGNVLGSGVGWPLVFSLDAAPLASPRPALMGSEGLQPSSGTVSAPLAGSASGFGPDVASNFPPASGDAPSCEEEDTAAAISFAALAVGWAAGDLEGPFCSSAFGTGIMSSEEATGELAIPEVLRCGAALLASRLLPPEALVGAASCCADSGLLEPCPVSELRLSTSMPNDCERTDISGLILSRIC